tara:strand:- start:2137 stop:3258 length:1122 start_codon:yes stop_codon:yes gene_type:complete
MAGIYIHIPFCKQACHYCDFHFSTSLKNKDSMLHTISKELFLRKEEVNSEIETIYFGGGTPSVLENSEINGLLEQIYKNYTVIENPEITLEANPDDLSEKRIIELSKTDINRLSIGIQSFFDEDLKMMNRSHTASESVNCLSVATLHFENITIDLIYGVPNMTGDRWRENLQKAFELKIPHISSYALTVEPKTPLDAFIKNGKYPPLNEELAAQHFDILIDETAKQRFVHYEISNFGKGEFFSKHNTSYWQGKQYLGVGPSAHSFNSNERSWNISNNTKYIKEIEKNQLPSEKEILAVSDVFNETIMTGLRTIWGVDLEKIQTKFGEEYKSHLLVTTLVFINQGLLSIERGVLKTTNKGKFLVDGIASDLFVV